MSRRPVLTRQFCQIAHTHSSGKQPPMGVEWWTHDAAQDESSVACQGLSMRVGEIRAEINRLLGTISRTPENIELVLDLMRRCQMLDQQLANWSRNLPEAFEYKPVTWEDNVPNGDFHKAEVYPGRVDIYRDIWVTSLWNLARTSRIMLSSAVVRCAAWVCAPIDYRTTPEYASATRVAQECINDIISSVPYLFGWFRTRKHLLERAGLSGFGCGDEDALKGLPGYLLSWPLYCVMSQDYTSDSQRAWVRGRLEFIGDKLGIKYAFMLNQVWTAHFHSSCVPWCQWLTLWQLNVRLPSMLIRRDGTMQSPEIKANHEGMLSGKVPPPVPYEDAQRRLLHVGDSDQQRAP